MFTRVGQPTWLCCDAVCGEGSKREQWHLLRSQLAFSHFPHYPQANWACLVLIPRWVGLWMFLVSPRNSPVRLGVSPAASTPTDVFNQWFEALFLHPGTLGCEVCHLDHELLPCQPATFLPILLHNLPLRWVRQLPHCCETSLPGCPSPPLLLVWVSVSSLSPWWSDFHTVRFSVSSGGFLFLNCCCPSFSCARRHSVSTYASILAGSP